MSSTSSSWRSSPPHAPQRSRRRLRLGDVGLLARVAVPDRQPVPPPELARDAPRPDVPHPLEVDALVVRRGRCGPRRARRPRSPASPARPCGRTTAARSAARSAHPSDGRRAPSACRAPPRAGGPRRAGPRPPRSRASAAVEPGEPLPRLVVHAPVLADHHDLVEAVGAADLEVVRVVTGGDLQRPRAELGVDVLIGDDRQAATDERQDAVPADELACSDRRSGSRRRPCRRASSPGERSPPSGPRRSPRRDSRCRRGCP